MRGTEGRELSIEANEVLKEGVEREKRNFGAGFWNIPCPEF
jgi:hypothetical protein